MSGIKEHNFPAFRTAAHVLREMGITVWSPVEMDEQEGYDGHEVEPGSAEWSHYLARDLGVVCDRNVDGVVVLPGWENSRGAALEVHVARELGKQVWSLTWDSDIDGYLLEGVKAPTKYQPPHDETILETAARLVDSDRGDVYGHPAEDFERQAGMMRALFGWPVEAKDIPLMMVCVKLSRLRQTPLHQDSVLDIAGYARTYEAVQARAGHKGFKDIKK
jgi:hypothetical protein